MVRSVYTPSQAASVLVWNWGQIGASAKFTFALASELRAVLGRNLVLSAARGSDLAALMAPDNFVVEPITTFEGDKFTRRGKLAAALGVARMPLITTQFRRMLRQHRIEVALCTFQSIWDAATLPILARGLVRSVLILHDAHFHPGDGYPLRYRVMRQQIRNTDALVVLSEHVRQQAIAAFNYPADRIWKMEHGAFAFTTEPCAARHPRGTRPLRVLFFGRLVAYKGIDHLLRAHQLLLGRGVAVELVIAGSGSLVPYESLLRTLPDVVVHNRWLDNEAVGDLLEAADLVVLPYTEASQSGVAGTAYTAGRPVVATPIGGLIEQVIHGETGLLARDMSTMALADAIGALVEDAALFDHCAEGALGHAGRHLGWHDAAQIVAKVIEAVCAMPRRADQERSCIR